MFGRLHYCYDVFKGLNVTETEKVENITLHLESLHWLQECQRRDSTILLLTES